MQPADPFTSPLFGYTFDPETLRDRADQPEALADWLADHEQAPVPGDPAGARQHHTVVGVAARMLRRLDIAEHHLGRAVELAEQHGPVASAVLARSRLAKVLQWQGRFPEAIAEFDRCLVEGCRTPELGTHVHFIFQNAGKCYYDAGEWGAARHCFATAIRMRPDCGGVQPEDTEPDPADPIQLAWDAADACVAGRAVDNQLNRLLTALYQVVADHGGTEVVRRHGLPDRGGILLELRNLLLAGPVPRQLAMAVHRYVGDLEETFDELVDTGWLCQQGYALMPTPRCTGLLTEVVALLDKAVSRLWPEPELALSLVDTVAAGAMGTSDGPVFDAWMRAVPAGSASARLADRLCALRYHRADAHAAAWSAEGLTAAEFLALDQRDPLRQRVETAADRAAARPYRRLTPDCRGELIDALEALPS